MQRQVRSNRTTPRRRLGESQSDLSESPGPRTVRTTQSLPEGTVAIAQYETVKLPPKLKSFSRSELIAWIEQYRFYYQKMLQQLRTPDAPELFMDKYTMSSLIVNTKAGNKKGIALIEHLEASLGQQCTATERWRELLKKNRLTALGEYQCMNFFANQDRTLGDNGVPDDFWKETDAWKTRMRDTWECIPTPLATRLKHLWNAKINTPKSWQDFVELLIEEAKHAQVWTNEKSSSSSGKAESQYNPKAARQDNYHSKKAADSRKRRGSFEQGRQARQTKQKSDRQSPKD